MNNLFQWHQEYNLFYHYFLKYIQKHHLFLYYICFLRKEVFDIDLGYDNPVWLNDIYWENNQSPISFEDYDSFKKLKVNFSCAKFLENIEKDGEQSQINIDGCFAYVGYVPNSELVSQLQRQLETANKLQYQYHRRYRHQGRHVQTPDK